MPHFNVHRTLDNGYELYAGQAIIDAGFTMDDLLEIAQLAFGASVGGSGSFRSLVGIAYGDNVDSRQDHILITHNKKPIGLILTYPRFYQMGDKSILSIGIGTVSAHPDYRGQGIMQTMMNCALERCKVEGAAFMSLGGQRQRYATFGFENVSAHPMYSFNARNFRGVEPMDASQVEHVREDVIENYEFLSELYEIYLRHVRTPSRGDLDNFARTVRMWEYDLYVLRNADDEIIGYARGKKYKPEAENLILEELCIEPEDLIPFLALMVKDGKLDVSASAHQVEIQQTLQQYCEGSDLAHRIKASFTNCEQTVALALAQNPFGCPPYERELRTINALGEAESFMIPAQSEGEPIELSYQEFQMLFSLQYRYELSPDIQVALAPLLPLTLPDLYADQV